MKKMTLSWLIALACVRPLCAQQPDGAVVRDDPLTWKVVTVRIEWEFDGGTDRAVVKKFNDAVDITLATVDGFRGSAEAGGEGSPALPRNPFLQMGLLKLQSDQGLLENRYIHLSQDQGITFAECRKALSAVPPTVRFSRLQVSFTVTVYNNTEADIALSGSGEVPVFCRDETSVIAKPKEPLNRLILPARHASGADLVFCADLDVTQAGLLMSAAARGMEINLVRAQIKALQNGKDLRLAMDMNSRRTYKFSISNGDDDLIAWRVKKRAGAGGAELTVADIIGRINATGLRDDSGKPLLKIKDGRCVGIGASPAIGKEYLLIADHGPTTTFFLWDWPLDTPIQGDVAIRLISLPAHHFGPGANTEVVQGVSKYEALTHDSFAQVMLGTYFQLGVGVKKDEPEALNWYRKAAAQGNGFAMYCLGSSYLGGLGVEKNEKEALSWLRRAAEQGNADAQYRLGYCYEMGSYVEEDDREAVKWYRKGAEQGELCSQYRLGRCYGMAVGVAKDDREAVKWYRKAADQGHGDAENSYGFYLQNGTAIGKDEREAVKWFRRAATRGFLYGVHNLGECYEKGRGVEKNEKEAVRWFVRGAKRGALNAMNSLGSCYLKGTGIEKDEREAVKWFRKAAEQGSRIGQNNLGYCYKNGFGVEKDGREAVKWLRLAVDQGASSAYKTLGLCYLEGLGVEKDEAEGIRLLRKAVEMGVTLAQDELKKIGK